MESNTIITFDNKNRDHEYIYFLIILLFINITNLYIIFSIILKKSLKTVSNFYIINLCVNGLFISYSMIGYLITLYFGFTTDLLTYSIVLTNIISIISSNLLVLLITLCQYAYTLDHKSILRTIMLKYYIINIVIVWILSIMIGAIYSLEWNNEMYILLTAFKILLFIIIPFLLSLVVCLLLIHYYNINNKIKEAHLTKYLMLNVFLIIGFRLLVSILDLTMSNRNANLFWHFSLSLFFLSYSLFIFIFRLNHRLNYEPIKILEPL